MKSSNTVAVSVLSALLSLSGCNLTDDDKKKLNDAQVDLEQIADQVIITFPANSATITDSVITVKADIPAAAQATEATLYVDGIEVGRDTDGAPWEINWPAYYWADGNQHTLLIKTVSEAGNEIRNNQQFQVTVSTTANASLSFKEGTNGSTLKDTNTYTAEYQPLSSATQYEVSYTNNEQTNITTSTTTSAELTRLTLGQTTLQYRATANFGNTVVTGPWSAPATITLVQPDLPLINTPVVSNSESGYNVDVSWEKLAEGDIYSASLLNTTSLSQSTFQIENDTTLTIPDVLAGNYELTLQRTNSLGQRSLQSEPIKIAAGVFEKRFGGAGDQKGKRLLTTSSKDLIVLGSTSSSGDINGDDWIFKLDEKGNTLWELILYEAGQPKLNNIVELTNGNIIGYGKSGTWPNWNGFIILISKNGQKIWQKEYTNDQYNQFIINGISELDGSVYAIAQGAICSTDNSNTTKCNIKTPYLQRLNSNNGNIVSSIKLPALNDVNWYYVSSMRKNSLNNFALSHGVKQQNCTTTQQFCYAAAITIINPAGDLVYEWNGFNGDIELGFNGKWVKQLNDGSYALSRNGEIGMPIVLLDSSLNHTGTYFNIDNYYTTSKSFSTNNEKTIYQIGSKLYYDYPILLSMDSDKNYKESYKFYSLNPNLANPNDMSVTNNNEFSFLFTEYQSQNNNPNIVVIKIGTIE